MKDETFTNCNALKLRVVMINITWKLLKMKLFNDLKSKLKWENEMSEKIGQLKWKIAMINVVWYNKLNKKIILRRLRIVMQNV